MDCLWAVVTSSVPQAHVARVLETVDGGEGSPERVCIVRAASEFVCLAVPGASQPVAELVRGGLQPCGVRAIDPGGRRRCLDRSDKLRRCLVDAQPDEQVHQVA